jgi:hypothetical protein
MQAREQNRVLWPSVQNRGKLFVLVLVEIIILSAAGQQQPAEINNTVLTLPWKPRTKKGCSESACE